MKFRAIGISNDLCPEGQKIDVWYHYEREDNGEQHAHITNVVNSTNKSILSLLSEKYLRELAKEIEQMDGNDSENFPSIRDDEKYMAFKECTL